MKNIDLAFGSLESRAGILYFIIKDGAFLDKVEMHQLFDACKKIADHKPFLLISDARVNLDITSEGRKVAADKDRSSLVLANAVLVNSLAVRLVANVFSRINRPPFPYQVFNSEKKAIEWLRQQGK